MEIYLSSESLAPKDLTPEEHYSNRLDELRKHFGFREDRDPDNPNLKYGFGITHTITRWLDPGIPYDRLGKPLDIVYVKNQHIDSNFWIPTIDYRMIKAFFDIHPFSYNFDVNLVSGRQHYMGKFLNGGFETSIPMPGYQIEMYSTPFGYNPDSDNKPD